MSPKRSRKRYRAKDDRRTRQVTEVRRVMAAPQPEIEKVDKGHLEHIEQLSAEAQQHRNRMRLYRARLQSGRLASAERLKELERISELADSRLARAKEDGAPG